MTKNITGILPALGLAMAAFHGTATFADAGTNQALARGGDGPGNGGDPCEMRIQDIVFGLKSWINDRDPEDGKVGPDGFTGEELNRDGVSLNGETRAERIADYITRMDGQIKGRKFYTKKQIQSVTLPQNEKLLVIECVKTENPVEVNVDLSDLAKPEFHSFERVCWNSGGSDQVAQITCDREVFDRLSQDPKKNQDLQYSLIHHEIAGLSGIEGNFRYGLSRVVSEFMETKEVRTLGRKRHDGGGGYGTPDLTDIAKDGSGAVLRMDQYDAGKYCKNQGERLPTIRELALWATQYGAKIADSPQDGFSEIDGSDPQGNKDVFYFQFTGYPAPQGEQSQYYGYWSSSVVPDDSGGAYVLIGDGGDIDNDARSVIYNNGVRCVRSR